MQHFKFAMSPLLQSEVDFRQPETTVIVFTLLCYHGNYQQHNDTASLRPMPEASTVFLITGRQGMMSCLLLQRGTASANLHSVLAGTSSVTE